MAHSVYQKTVSWLNRRTFRWSLTRRLFAFLLIADVVVLAAVTVVDVEFLDAVASAGEIGVSQAHLVIFIVATALALGLITAISLITIKSAAMRIIHVGDQVGSQLTSGDIDIAVSPEPEDEIGRLIGLLNQLGQVYRASLQTLARRADEMAMLDLVATTINRTLDLQEVLDTSLRQALKTVKWDAGAIYMWDERNESLNMVSFTGLSEDTVRRNITYRLGESIIGLSAERREIMTVGTIIRAGQASDASAPGWPAAQISLPLATVPGQLLGTLILATDRKETMSDDELRLLETVSAQIALAIDKAQLYTKVSEHAEELETIVAARTEQLSQAIEELWIALKQAREADRVKSLLLSTVSHELRTPLATIKGNTSLLIEHHDRIPGEQLIDHLRDIEEETDKLTELISNLLEMSRIEAGSLHIQTQDLDLVSVLREGVAAAALRYKDRPVQFSSSRDSLIVSGDPRRIGQIVSNLVDNAAKYSAPQTEIDIRVAGLPDQAVVSVQDHGIGIGPEHLEQIFERFYQIKSGGDSGRQGIGLGLAICRGLVEAQGGQIWVESELHQGSTFYFSLPLKRRVHRNSKRKNP